VVSAAVTYNDSTEDIDAGLSDGNGTLDIVSVEVSHTATDVIFALTVDGNVSSDDWGTFMIGIATGGAGTTNSAGWSRPIYLDSPIGGMNYWIGSRVDSGGEAQLWSYNGMGWNFTGALTAFSFTPGAQSLVIFTVAQADVGLSSGDRFYFDVYASGGLDTDSAVDALSNPNVSIWEWTQAYTSRTNDTGLSDYTLAVTADVVPSQGPFAGGNMVVVTNAVPAIGDGSDITNVTMGGVAATLAGQGANWVSFVAPATDSAGAKDIVIQSASLGDITFAGAYTVNPAGQIGGTQYGPCAWTNLGSGMNDQVYALAHDGTDLYAGGYFTNAGGVAANRVAKWDSASGTWTNLGSGMNDLVYALAHDGTDLYAGGQFTNAGGVAANRVAKWDSASGTWTNLGSGMDYEVVALAHDGTDLYAGGGFWTAGEVAADRVAKWDSASGTWTNLGSGMNSTVPVLAHDGTDLYAGGWFTYAGEVAANRVAKWDPASGTWTHLGSGMENGVLALAHDGTDLYAAGWFTNAGGVAANRVAKWDSAGGTWTNLGSGMEYVVKALAHDGTDLYAGGRFTTADGVAANYVAKWDSASGTWTNLGSGMDYEVGALAHDGTDLYAGGSFTNAGGVAANYVAKWGPTTIDFGGVAPPSGSSTGGFPVVISGTNLCDGTIGDVTNVTLCGVAATVTGVSGSTQIVVTAGTAAGAILGDVRVFSTSFGQTVKSNAFEYLRQQQASLVFNPVSPQAYLTTNALAVSGGAGTGAVSFLVLSGPGTLVDDTNLAVTASSGTIEIRATKAQDDLYEEASVTGTVTATKADQIIADFLPADGSTFVETNTVELSATASSGLEVTFTVLSGPGAIQDGTNLTFTGYGQVSLAARQEGNDNWNAASEVVHTCTVLGIFTITVESPYGTATPAAGAYEWVQGTVFTNQIETPDTQGSTQYVCNGWMATENLDPIGGVGTQAVVTVNGDGTMSWLWTTNYWLETAAAHGSVNVAAGWQPGGETTQITATPEPYYAFSLWFGDTSGDENPLDLLMDGPKSVTAYFTALMTSNRPTPLWWLADHGITEAFEAAVDGDPDEDSVPTGDEWVMDTDPTNGASFLAFDAVWPLYGSNCWDVVWTNEEPPYEIVTNLECEVIGHVFQWRASTSRVYTVQWSPIPIGPLSWSDVVGMRRLHPAASSLTVTNGAAGGERGLYRIRVNLPVE